MRTSLLAALGAAVTLSFGTAVATSDSASPARTMHEIFDAVAYLLPASMNAIREREYGDPALVREKLAALSESADTLLEHTRGQEQEFQLLAQAFDHRIADVKAAFESDYPAFGYFALMGLIEHCAACHARLPDQTDFVFGQRLLARMNVDDLDRQDLADILVATRQFDVALGELEAELFDSGIHPIDHDLAGTLIDYLNVAITVQQDTTRPTVTLRRYLERGDVPYFLRRRIGHWLTDLAELKPTLTAPASYETARSLFAKAGERIAVPGDRSAAVQDLAAASILRRLLAGGMEGERKAEAYYMLGVVALRTSELRPSVPEMEMLLVAAIRSAPKSPRARDAYALLEEFGFIEDQRLTADPDAQPLIDLAELEGLIGD